MRVLIVGMGYSGSRFLSCFKNLSKNYNIELSYCDTLNKNINLKYYSSIDDALNYFNPEIIVISNSDGFHYDVISKLSEYKGFIIAEKPLVSYKDDLNTVRESLSKISGFCMDFVERYSENTYFLKKFVSEKKLKLIKCNFFWFKNRVGDYRETTGVISEIVHPLDLINHLNNSSSKFEVNNTIGLRSDFSISGPEISDSVCLTGNIGDSAVIGYSSFVNLTRNRTLELTYKDVNESLVYVLINFDNPVWDSDYIKIWMVDEKFNEVLIHENQTKPSGSDDLKTIIKLSKLVSDVVNFIKFKEKPKVDFSDLNYSLYLQEVLNTIDVGISKNSAYKYFEKNENRFLFNSNDLEKLG